MGQIGILPGPPSWSVHAGIYCDILFPSGLQLPDHEMMVMTPCPKRKAALDSVTPCTLSESTGHIHLLSHTTLGLCPALPHSHFFPLPLHLKRERSSQGWAIGFLPDSLLLFLHLTSLGNFYLVFEKNKGTGKKKKNWL